jgi:hypothetical protein
MPFQKGNKFGRGRVCGSKNKLKPPRIYCEIEIEKIGFRGSKQKLVELCKNNPAIWFRILKNQFHIEVKKKGKEQLEFDFKFDGENNLQSVL